MDPSDLVSPAADSSRHGLFRYREEITDHDVGLRLPWDIRSK